MCGIAGLLLKTEADAQYVSDTIGRLDELLFHRGPDHGGAHLQDDRGFLNRRLAIVDQKGGDQPIYSPDRRSGIVYNGEVYNFPELRKECEARGDSFTTHTDTETILKTYLFHGEEGFAKFEGMFGLCIWNEDSGDIVLARDAFGMKPLYIYEDARQIIFSSELSAIVGLPELDLALDPVGIGDYLTFRYVPAPRTIYRHIRRMSPGAYVKLSKNGVGLERSFLDLSAGQQHIADLEFDEAKSRLRELLMTSVKQHLVGEAPIALLLSGGVDSSILAAVLNELGVPMEGFNIGFPDLNEFEYATDVANRHNITLHNVEIEPSLLAQNCEQIIAGLDEPIADPAQFPLHFLCEEIRKYATVVLSGEGADELFGGYPQYQTHTRPQNWSDQLPSFLRSSYYFLDNEPYIDRLQSLGWQGTRRYMLGRSPLVAQSVYDFKTWVPDNLMMKADKIAMRHSLEGRFPFLTHELFAFAHSLPDSWKISQDGVTKHVLKEAYTDLLPTSVLNRGKMGFSVPTAAILREMKDYIQDSLNGLEQSDFGEIVRLDSVRQTFDAFWSGKDTLALRCWTLFVLAAWVNDRQSRVDCVARNTNEKIQVNG